MAATNLTDSPRRHTSRLIRSACRTLHKTSNVDALQAQQCSIHSR